MQTKRKIYKQFLVPVLFYAPDAWFPCSSQRLRLERYQKSQHFYDNKKTINLKKAELLPIKMALELKDILLFNNMVNGLMDFPVWDHIYVESATIYSLRRDAKIAFSGQKYANQTSSTEQLNMQLLIRGI